METIIVVVFVFGGVALLAAILYANHSCKKYPEILGKKDRPE